MGSRGFDVRSGQKPDPVVGFSQRPLHLDELRSEPTRSELSEAILRGRLSLVELHT